MKSYFGDQSLQLMAALFSVLVSASFCQAYFPKNESTYLNFHIPTHLRHNISWQHAASSFGRLGQGPEGSMVLPVKMMEKNHHLCGGILDPNAIINQLNIPADFGAPFILLVERGVCTFVKKVRNAQHLGAAAVLIADTDHEHLPFTTDNDEDEDFDILFLDSDNSSSSSSSSSSDSDDDSNHTKHESSFRMADDGSGRDISIPSMMIGNNEYESIKKVIQSKPNNTGIVVAEFAWHVPKYDSKVAMELWSSPIDTHTKEFLASNFSAIARAFDLNEMHGNTHENDSYNEGMNLMRFRERPVLLNGKALGCLGNTDAPDEPCYKLCTNGGRYCHASTSTTDGMDVVTEALRRLCISKHYKSPKFYWDYIDHFSNFCWDSDYFANEKCVKDAYEHSNIDKASIESCFKDSGNPKEDQANALLEQALDMQLKRGVHQSPTVMINHELSPIISFQGLSPRTVLFSLCETFAYGEKPHICYACMQCGDPVACAKRSPMKCLEGDGDEKEDTNAHKQEDKSGGKSGGKSEGKRSRIFRWFFSLFLAGGLFGAYVYYKKQMDGISESGLGSYSLQDAFLSNTE